MWLLEQSLGGMSTAMVFQVYELLDSYQQVYGVEANEELGSVAIALAKKVRATGKFPALSAEQRTLEMQMFAAALRTNAFSTLHDCILHELRATEGCSAKSSSLLDCCCELSLFNSLNWPTAQIHEAAKQLKRGNLPLPSSELNAKLLQKHSLGARRR